MQPEPALPTPSLPAPDSSPQATAASAPVAVSAAEAAAGASTRGNTMTIFQLVISGLGVVISLLGAGLLFISGLVGVFSETGELQSVLPVFGMAWGGVVLALLLVPSVVVSILRLTGRDIQLPRIAGFRLASIILLLWPLVLYAGSWVSGQSSLAWLLLPPLQILAIGIPLWWLFELARRGLSTGSGQRGWGLLSFSLLISTPTVIIVEFIVIAMIVVGLVLWVTGQPALMADLERLGQQLSLGSRDPEEMLNLVRPLLQNPLVIYGTLAVIAGLIPLIEEALKPLAIWVLIGRRLTPAEGFAAGALCGAAFSLIESLTRIGGAAQGQWLEQIIGQSGPALLHITTTSFMGWALASAWRNGGYVRMGLAYLLAVSLHSLWNGLVIITAMSAVLSGTPNLPPVIKDVGPMAPLGLGSMIIILFFLLWGSNQQLRQGNHSIS